MRAQLLGLLEGHPDRGETFTLDRRKGALPDGRDLRARGAQRLAPDRWRVSIRQQVIVTLGITRTG
jgi:hypothetical protein